MVRSVEQRVDGSDRQPFSARGNLLDHITGRHRAFLDHTKVESRPPMGHQQGCHLGIAQADTDFETGYSRLGDLEDRATDAEAVPDTNLGIRQALHREVLAELSIYEVGPLEMLGPVTVGVELIDHDGSVLAAVAHRIGHAVAVKARWADPYAPGHRAHADGGAEGFARHCTSLGKPT